MSRQSQREAQRQAVMKLGDRSSPPKEATLLKQYELLRSEITTSLQIQQQILGFGIATIGLLAGAAFVGHTKAFRSELLVVFLPLISYLVVMIWFSEVMRMVRAGGFLLRLERDLDECGDGSLTWESVVAQSRRTRADGNAYFAIDPDRLRLLGVTALFFVLGGESIRLGWDRASWFARLFAITAGVVAAIVLRLLFRLRIAQWEELLDLPRHKTLDERVVDACRRFLTSVVSPARHRTVDRTPAFAS